MKTHQLILSTLTHILFHRHKSLVQNLWFVIPSSWNVLYWAFLEPPPHHSGFIWNITYSKMPIPVGLQSILLLSSPVTLLCFAFLVSPTCIRTVSVQITNAVINKTHTAIHQTELQAIIIRGHVIKNRGHLRNICSRLSLTTSALFIFSDLLPLPMFQNHFYCLLSDRQCLWPEKNTVISMGVGKHKEV